MIFKIIIYSPFQAITTTVHKVSSKELIPISLTTCCIWLQDGEDQSNKKNIGLKKCPSCLAQELKADKLFSQKTTEKLKIESGLSKSQICALNKIAAFFQNISAAFQFYLRIPYQKGEAAFTYLYWK